MWALVLLALFPTPARSQTATTSVIVHVVDDVTKTPIVRASVRLVSDSREYRGLTDATGTSRFPNVEPDSYDVITYQHDLGFSHSSTIAVAASSSSSVTVLGTRTRLARIGGVETRGPAKPDPATTQNADFSRPEPSAPEGFTIAAHVATTETWLEIRADDLSIQSVLTRCLAIPYVRPKNLTERGLGGGSFSTINYAPSVGFYNKAG
jgi:hypothetical protein